MISKFLKEADKLSRGFRLSDKLRYNFTSGYGYKDPQNDGHKIYSPRIHEKIVWINVVNKTQIERIPAYEGESLLESFLRMKVANVPATCLGGEDINTMLEKPIDPLTMGPFCSNCHVIISDPWRQQMGRINYLEVDQLEKSLSPITPNSRLACCILVEPWMNDMIVTIGGNHGTALEDGV